MPSRAYQGRLRLLAGFPPQAAQTWPHQLVPSTCSWPTLALKLLSPLSLRRTGPISRASAERGRRAEEGWVQGRTPWPTHGNGSPECACLVACSLALLACLPACLPDISVSCGHDVYGLSAKVHRALPRAVSSQPPRPSASVC